jgi:hypothetical protein
MTDQQINAAIARECGDYICECCKDICKDCDKNYCTDLNAMHEAENVLTRQQTDKYVTTLCLEVQPEPSLHNATARQRAEAFLRTLGKWEEGK